MGQLEVLTAQTVRPHVFLKHLEHGQVLFIRPEPQTPGLETGLPPQLTTINNHLLTAKVKQLLEMAGVFQR
jgi:hypothetical protein